MKRLIKVTLILIATATLATSCQDRDVRLLYWNIQN